MSHLDNNICSQQCDSKRAVSLLSEISFNESVMVGCGCSLATEEAASRSDIPVVSYILYTSNS